VAGVVTYYYHVNEPTDQDGDDSPAQITRTVFLTAHKAGPSDRLCAFSDRAQGRPE
jgi:hypothetical protein